MDNNTIFRKYWLRRADYILVIPDSLMIKTIALIIKQSNLMFMLRYLVTYEATKNAKS